MPKPIQSKLPRVLKAKTIASVVKNPQQMTVKETADEIESLRFDLLKIVYRLDKLSWALMTRGVKPGKVRETSGDIPFDDIPF